jgi:hypothetical protein
MTYDVSSAEVHELNAGQSIQDTADMLETGRPPAR